MHKAQHEGNPVTPEERAYEAVKKQHPNSRPTIFIAEPGTGVISGIYRALEEMGIPAVLVLNYDGNERHILDQIEQEMEDASCRQCAVLFESAERHNTAAILRFMRTRGANPWLRLYATWDPKPGVWESVKSDNSFQVKDMGR